MHAPALGTILADIVTGAETDLRRFFEPRLSPRRFTGGRVEKRELL
jgi:hypothetical protein